MVKKGRHCSEEVKKKISEATKGVKKNNTKPNSSWFPKGHKPKAPFKKGMTPWNKGKKMPPWVGKAVRDRCRGKKHTLEHRENQRQAQLKRWSTIEKSNGRRGVKSRTWSKNIIERDGNKCTKCGSAEKLHAHHIVPWNESEDLRFDLDNGITYCKSCHTKEELKNKKRRTNKGFKFTEEQKKRLSEAHMGQKAWNKGKYTPPENRKKCTICGIEKDIEYFTPQGKYRTGMCKECRNKKLKLKRLKEK